MASARLVVAVVGLRLFFICDVHSYPSWPKGLGLIVVPVLVLYIIVAFVYPLWKMRGIKKLAARLREFDLKSEQTPSPKQSSYLPIAVFGLVLYSLVAAVQMGESFARGPKRLLVLPSQSRSQPELVVLYTDGDSFVCAPLRKPGQQQNEVITLVLLDRSALARDKTPMQRRIVQFRELGRFVVPELQE